MASENKNKSSKSTSSTCVIVGSMLDGLTLLGLLLFLVLWCPSYKKHGRMREIMVPELQEAWENEGNRESWRVMGSFEYGSGQRDKRTDCYYDS
ncbi:hypothetical protein HID58_005323 [Brassica napus]|uniref:Transmembrane protein n=1 Tax=Brassica napus TaxID=3708 RepID=A0ABQ8E8A7_BRANA|nr:hypothetical protein HID58_005323 [Brassica napus]